MQFVRTLGRGSYGEVAQCEDLKEGGLVAIKRVLNVFNSEVRLCDSSGKSAAVYSYMYVRWMDTCFPVITVLSW